ncbi:MAG: hypothetical protein NT040_11075 [Bacteroidetes bacterium]|nr:hypothetical protein [Bacteroidota bacterium]
MRRIMSTPQHPVNFQLNIIKGVVANALLLEQFSHWQATTGDAVEIAQIIFNAFANEGIEVIFHKSRITGSDRNRRHCNKNSLCASVPLPESVCDTG